jgi:transcriptional regulator with XRE-family HTH domain
MATSEPGDLIYQQRRRRGWSKTQLCEEIQSWEYRHGNEETLGLNPNYVREWERGERSVSDHYAPKLAAVLELPIEVFVDRRSRRGRVAVSQEAKAARPASPVAGGSDRAAPALLASTTSTRDRLAQQWSDLALLGPLGQRLLDKILEPQRSLMVDRRTMRHPGSYSGAMPRLPLSPSTSSRRRSTCWSLWLCAIRPSTTRHRRRS